MGLPDMRVIWQTDVPTASIKASRSTLGFERHAIKRSDGTMVVRRLADNQGVARTSRLATSKQGAVGGFSPDGRYLAMKSWNDHDSLEIWDLKARRAALTVSDFSGNLTPTWAFHPDGRQLAFGRLDGTIVVIDLDRWTRAAQVDRRIWAGPVRWRSITTDRNWHSLRGIPMLIHVLA